MAVYVDQLMTYPSEALHPGARLWGTTWCHMFADCLDELHEFARRLGLNATWFQGLDRRPWARHYDLTPSTRQRAIALGAREITAREWFQSHRSTGGNTCRS